MAKTATVRARIEPDLKEEVEDIFHEIGLSTTDAITLFFKNVSMEKGLPFALKVPNKETRRTFKQTDDGVGIVKAKDADDMFKKLGV